MSDARLKKLLAQVRATTKYGDVHPDIVARVASTELAKRSSTKEALKSTKRKLHQIGGAYFRERMRYDAWRETLEEAQGDRSKVHELCRRILEAHASTHERLPELEQFYSTLLGDLPPINRLLDLACGMNPAAVPWMGLAPNCRYTGVDIYADMMGFLADLAPALGVQPDMCAGDIMACELPSADVALVLKALPVLDQVDPTASLALLERIDASIIVATYPIKSLGRRNKGMPQNYRRRFEELVAGKPWGIEIFQFESELAFRVRKG